MLWTKIGRILSRNSQEWKSIQIFIIWVERENRKAPRTGSSLVCVKAAGRPVWPGWLTQGWQAEKRSGKFRDSMHKTLAFAFNEVGSHWRSGFTCHRSDSKHITSVHAWRIERTERREGQPVRRPVLWSGQELMGTLTWVVVVEWVRNSQIPNIISEFLPGFIGVRMEAWESRIKGNPKDWLNNW